MTKAIARAPPNLARLVHNYGQLTAELADKDHQITNLVDAGNAMLQAFANENQNISTAVAKLPGALNQTQTTLAKVGTLATVLRPSLDSLRPAVRKLNSANHEVLPFVKEAAPITRNQIRPVRHHRAARTSARASSRPRSTSRARSPTSPARSTSSTASSTSAPTTPPAARASARTASRTATAARPRSTARPATSTGSPG